MTEQPNITKIVLDYAIKRSAKGEKPIMYDLCDQTEYTVGRLADRVDKLYPALECGVSPRVPWLCDKSEAIEWYEKWDATPPECIDQADWIMDENGELL